MSNKRKKVEKAEGTVESLGLECPAWLSELACEQWRRIVGELTVLGVLSKFDLPVLAVYCTAYAAWVEATEAIQQYGAVIKAPSGYPQQSPYVAIQKSNAELMVNISKEFGFTPAARSRNFSFDKSRSMLLVQPTEGSQELMPLASFLGREDPANE